jgi:hypothetical protein
MLETIPIVKFNENDGVDAAKRDIELANSDDPNHEHSPTSSQEHVADQTTPHETEMQTAEQQDDRPTPAPVSRNDATDAGNFSCPICTDDFVKGQDLRVLPCNHQFHPECIDPWLINVSGTCPLWYVFISSNIKYLHSLTRSLVVSISTHPRKEKMPNIQKVMVPNTPKNRQQTAVPMLPKAAPVTDSRVT